MNEDKPTRDLKIFLLKEDVPNDPSELFSSAVEQIQIPGVGVLYYKPSFADKARWLDLFRIHVPEDRLRHFYNSSSRAILIVPVDDRLFALAFGYGRYLLKDSVWDPRFGIRTTLNLIQPDSLRSIDKTTLGSVPLHSREQLSRRGTANDFGINFDEDIVKAVTGKSKIFDLGTTVSGSDVLAITVQCELEDIPSLLRSYFEYSGKDDYKKDFGWIDYVHELTDKTKIACLDENLIEKMRINDTDHVWLAVPNIIDWFGIGGFKYTKKESEPLHDDLDLEEFLDTVRDVDDISIDFLKHRRVSFFHSENEAIPVEWPIYKCLYAEIDLDGERFILTDQNWYRIDTDFVREVETACNLIPQCGIQFPDYNLAEHGANGSNKGELGYNETIVTENPLSRVLLDRKLVSLKGITPIEFCDVYTTEKQMIHVKRYGGSSSLSHLFQQGTVSAEFFASDSRFRSEVNQKLPEGRRVPEGEIDPHNYEVVFLVVSKSDRPLKLPFFSKVTLRGAARRLKGYRYNVSLSKVQTV